MSDIEALQNSIKELKKAEREKIQRLKKSIKESQENRQKQTGQPYHQS